MMEAAMRQIATKLRLVNLGRVSTRTRASHTGFTEEIGNYPMLWRF